MMLSSDDARALVGEANLAPSVHNTQPARWRFLDDRIEVFLDPTKLLAVGDPSGRDAGVSCGAAIEGMRLALSRRGIGVLDVEDFWPATPPDRSGAPILIARIQFGGTANPDPLAENVVKRFTWRGHFGPAADTVVDRLRETFLDRDDNVLVEGSDDMTFLADLNDRLSLRVLRDRAYREELVSFMRLSRGHRSWNVDGMNLSALRLSRVEGWLARVALRYPFFEVAARLGIGEALVTERQKTLSTTGALLFIQPREHSPLRMGRAFYRLWLTLTDAGFVAWPMAAISDDSEGVERCAERFSIPSTHRFINTLRFGICPDNVQMQPARHPPEALIDP